MKYHYVVFGCKQEYFSIMFKDAVDKLGVEYIANPIAYNHYNWFLKSLYSIHHYEYFNWPKELPLKKLWYPLYYKKKQYQPICFVFMMDWCKSKYKPLFKLLRKRYLDCKLVLYLEDIIASRKGCFEFGILKEFDEIYTYDKGDADQYHIKYYPTFMSKLDLPVKQSDKTNCCFWGIEKDRRLIINEIYDFLTSNGLLCDFLVTRCGDIKALSNGIKTSKRERSYISYLQAIVNTDCIVEIMHSSAVGYTLRTWEALLYGKVLLTNNKSMVNASFFNSKQIIVFDDPKCINIERLRKMIGEKYSFNIDSISPVHFFEMLDTSL